MKKFLIIIGISFVAVLSFLAYISTSGYERPSTFKLLSNPDNKDYMPKLVKYAKKNGITLEVNYVDDLDALDYIDTGSKYDAVWMSNSIWLYMLDNASVINSKSISINPVVMGIKKSKAQKLGFTSKDVYNKDIMNAIKSGNLKYVMTSVTKTNTGLTAYLGFLNSLAGSPEVLSSEMLSNKTLVSNLKSLFSGVERVSGTDTFLEDMFLNSSNYEAVIATESSLLRINEKLVSNNREPLYLIYPVDGVAINDSPFAYVDRDQNKIDKFLTLQSYLLSEDAQKDMQELGKRTWYGGTNTSVDTKVFNPEWGVDTTKYLIPLKYPSKSVMNEAINLYIDEIRKPTHLVFCLDYSGSMSGNGNMQLVSAMDYLLSYDEASKDRLQFSKNDKITVIPFNNQTRDIWKSVDGRNTSALINKIETAKPNGGTAIFDCSIEALKQLKFTSNDYTKTIILMTDGESNIGRYSDLLKYYNSNKLDIPIYSIMFGSAKEEQLIPIADLTNAKVFDGREDLIAAFKEVRSFN